MRPFLAAITMLLALLSASADHSLQRFLETVAELAVCPGTYGYS